MAKKQYPNYDNTLFGQYIRQIENPDSVGWNPSTRIWQQSNRKGDDKRNRGMGVDILNNDAAKALTKNRPDKYLTEAEEHQIRNEHIDYLLGVIEKQKKNHPGLINMSPRKQAEVLGVLYRGDANKLWNKGNVLGNALDSDNEEDFHNAIVSYYNSISLPERANNNNKFWDKNSFTLTKQNIVDAAMTIPTAIAEGIDKAVTFGKSIIPLKKQNNSVTPKDNTMRWAEGGFMYQPKDAWDNLSILEKSEMMKVAVRNGITDLKTIREKYNEFAEGGYLDWKEKVSKYKHLDIDNDRTYDYEGWYNENPQRAWDFLNDSPDAHFDDKYKTAYHPTFSTQSKYSGKKDAIYNPLGLVGGMWNKQGTVFTMSPDSYRGPVSMDERKWYLENAEDNGVQLREADGSLPVFDGIPWGGVLPNVTVYGKKHSIGGPLVENVMNEYRDGGGIHIKPSHRGRLTELKKRTGKTEAELYRTGSPATRKMITFARNARKWKHGLGGNLFDGTSEDTQQMQIAIPDATYVARTPIFSPISKKEYDWEDAALHRTNQVYSNYNKAKDEPLSLGNTIFRNSLRWVKDNIYEDFPSGVSNCTLSATQWVDPQTPVKKAKSIHTNPERFNYTAIDSVDIVPGNLIISKVPNKDSYHTMMVTGFAGQDSTANFSGKNYPVKKGEPLVTYSRGGHDNSFIQRNVPLSIYTVNSDGHTQNLFYRYNYPREVFLPEIVVTPNKKKK